MPADIRDVSRYTVEGHTARLTGAFWFVVLDTLGWTEGSQVGPHYDDREDAQHAADQLNEACA